LKKGFYGLHATLLCLTVMALLRIRTPEQLQGQPPGELGILLGLDRAPEVKTLRRKLGELAARRQATSFSQRLAERWVRGQADAVGLLYLDGHVRPYHGPAHTLPETFVTRRRLCLPATTDLWVQQQDAQPLFVVTAPANDDLLAMLRTPHADPCYGRLCGESGAGAYRVSQFRESYARIRRPRAGSWVERRGPLRLRSAWLRRRAAVSMTLSIGLWTDAGEGEATV